MCLGIPGRIIEINGFVARVDVAGAMKEADLRLMQEARPGDFVIIHAGFAIEKVDEAKARDTLDLIKEIAGK
ncbi:MAG: HypC/HybG/HupF family hydrogenase formation chaperone [Thermodesulfobacteriota bacterium]|nr:MAG: HypC/HybG/HupF family hydrogenase formation chaperone [Thermodesulfobacteriota bacterium]